MIDNEITCCECYGHIAWSDTGTLDNIYCDDCKKELTDQYDDNE